MGVVQYAHLDFTRDPLHRWQWTFTTNGTNTLVQLLGILITIALAQLWILVQSIWSASNRVRYPAGQSGEAAAASARRHRSLWEVIVDLLTETYYEIFPPVQLPGAPPKAQWTAILGRACLVCFAFAIFAGILLLGVLASRLQGDSSVITTSAACGVYAFGQDANTTGYALRSLFETKAQNDAQQYARLCYGGRKLDYGCDKFSHQAIAYQTTPNDDCPFGGGMCHLGLKGAITFDTGPTPASMLGINAKRTLQFDRSTTCAPVTMNDSFITHRNTIIDDCAEDQYFYHYGWSAGYPGEKTSWDTKTFGRAIENYRSYSVDQTYQEFGWNDKHIYPLVAIPELSPANGTVLTLIYIKSGRIYYLARSEDPIFPATQPYRISTPTGIDIEVWLYTGGHARVLACVDRVRWRDLQDGSDWHQWGEIPNEPPKSVVGNKWMLFLALRTSIIAGTISQATALNASSLQSSDTSLPVDPKQWEIEARQMFETSLARAQFEASYMSLGTYASYEGWTMTSPTIISPAICRHNYLSKNPEFANINGIIYLMILIPCLIIILLSCPCSDALLWEWLLGRERAGRWADIVLSVSRAAGITMYLILRLSWDGFLRLSSRFCTVVHRTSSDLWRWLRTRQLALRDGPPAGVSTCGWVLGLVRAQP